MSWGLEWLELDEAADERAIKRAYAARLRITRPDEDPAGFQQLHEAYQAALAWAKHRAQRDMDGDSGHVDVRHEPAAGTTVPITAEGQDAIPARSTPGESPEEPVVSQAPPLDASRFARVLVEAATNAQPGAMTRWLHDQPELWSMADRPRLGDAVLQRLHEVEEPIDEDTFDALSAWFDWDDVRSGVNPDHLAWCRSRLHGLWLLEQEDEEDGQTDPTVFREPVRRFVAPTDDDPRVLRLRRPWNRLRALLSASLPGRAHDMCELLARVHVKQGRRPFQPRQVEFWRALGRPREVNGPKMQLAAFRSALLAASFAAFMLMLGFADGFAGGHRGYWSYSGPALSGGLMLLLGGSLILPLVGFVQWQAGAEHPRQPAWIVRLLVIPVLAGVALWMMRDSDMRLLGIIVAWPVAALALARFLARGPFRMAFRPWMIGLIVILIPALEYSLVVLALGEIAVAMALLLWATDAVNHVPLSNAPRSPAKR